MGRGHIVAYTDGEIRQEYEVMLIARPVGGRPGANDEASDVRWVDPSDQVAFVEFAAESHMTAGARLFDLLFSEGAG